MKTTNLRFACGWDLCVWGGGSIPVRGGVRQKYDRFSTIMVILQLDVLKYKFKGGAASSQSISLSSLTAT